jgi:hypothetical protein
MADRNFNRDRNRPYEGEYNENMEDQDFRARNQYGRGYDEFRSGRSGYGQYGRGGQDRYGGGYNRSGGQWRVSRDMDQQRGGQRGTQYHDSNFDDDYDRWNRGRYGGGFGNYGGAYEPQGRRDYGQQSGFDEDYNDEFDYDYDFDIFPTTWSYSDVWLIPGPFTGVGPQDYQRSDERILEDVNERLTQHGRLDARNIHVEVSNCEVTLTGTVEDRQSKRMAEDVAESVSGVKDVHNQLRLQERQQNRGQQQGQFEQSQQHQQHQTQQQAGQQAVRQRTGRSGRTES